jgi:gas vesicle protein
MSDELDEHELEIESDPEGTRWNAGSFIAGIVVGAAVGAGVALLLAPGSGNDTRRAIRRRVRRMSRDASGGWVSARQEVRRILKEKKAALRDRVDQLAEKLD